MSKKSLILLSVALIVILAGLGIYLKQAKLAGQKPGFCAQDVRQCPDGSFVSRVAPSCDFGLCPETKPREISIYCAADGCKPRKTGAGVGTLIKGCFIDPNECAAFASTSAGAGQSDWKVFNDAAAKLEFRYPEKISTGYVNPLQWPPKAAVAAGPLRCDSVPAGTSSPETKAVSKKINGADYCLKTSVGAAAGSTYTDYAYQTMRAERLLSLSFTLQTPRCENYPEPQKASCQKEQADFDADTLADGILKSVKLY
jgi:hypothetical protein